MAPKFKASKKGSRISLYQKALDTSKTLPTKFKVIHRLTTIQEENNGRLKNFVNTLVAKEIELSWKNQDVPAQKYKGFLTKLKRLKRTKGYICRILSDKTLIF